MRVNILSFEKVIFQDKVDSLTAPGVMGELTILPYHAPLITILKKGKLILKKGEEKITFPIEKGILEIANNEVNVLIF